MLVDQRNLSRQFRLGYFVLTLRCSWCLLKISRSDVKKELRIFVSFQNVFIIVLHILNELGYKLSILSNNKINLFFKTKKTHIVRNFLLVPCIIKRNTLEYYALKNFIFYRDYHY